MLMIFTVLIFLAILASGGAAIGGAMEDSPGGAIVGLIICAASIGLFIFLLGAQGYLDNM